MGGRDLLLDYTNYPATRVGSSRGGLIDFLAFVNRVSVRGVSEATRGGVHPSPAFVFCGRAAFRTLHSPTQETAFSAQFGPGMRSLAFDFAAYCEDVRNAFLDPSHRVLHRAGDGLTAAEKA